MLGERSPQRGLFEADTMFADFVGRRNFYGFLASQRDELFRDEDFATLYCRDNGRPSVPPSLLATALVLQTYDGVSDDEAKQRADYDLRWKVALGIELDARPFAKSTLQEFRAQLIVHEQTRAIFQQSLEVAKRRGVWKKGHAPHERQHIKLALDTTHILGRGAVKDTYNLLADGIVEVLRGLAKLVACDVMEVAEEVGCARYVLGPSLKGQADVDWTDPQARQCFLAEIVTDAEQLLELVRGTRSDLTKDSPEDKALVAAAEVLARILGQDIERDEYGPRLKRGVAPDRLISVYDPEMRHGRKSSSHRFNGHKAQVAVDTDTQLITAVEVLPGNAPDAEQALEVVEASEAATGCEVEEVIGDCAYGAGETRAEFAASGRTVVAKVPEMQNQGYFPKTAFAIDLEASTCTCPNNQQTRDFRPAQGGGGTFVFAIETCAACPLRSECTRGQGGRTVFVHPQEALLQRAREFQATAAFDDARRRRQMVEHRIARLAQLGIRQARYFGRTKTLFQVCLAAAVANLTLLAATSGAAWTANSVTLGTLLALLAALLGLKRRILPFRLIAPATISAITSTQLIGHFHPIIRPLTPPCRPGF
ncbi:MAG: IS1182-like element ISGvi6 family transposase [Candidatus Dormibacteraceae bacterium]